jgi:hypothetical protein
MELFLLFKSFSRFGLYGHHQVLKLFGVGWGGGCFALFWSYFLGSPINVLVYPIVMGRCPSVLHVLCCHVQHVKTCHYEIHWSINGTAQTLDQDEAQQFHPAAVLTPLNGRIGQNT